MLIELETIKLFNLGGSKILHFELALEKDLPLIEEIIQNSYQEVKERLSRPPGAIIDTKKKLVLSLQHNQLYIVYKTKKTIIGTFSLSPTDRNTIKMFHFAITPEFQNQGIGTWVVKEVIKMQKTQIQKYKAIELEVYAKIPELFKFYEKLGFSLIGEKEINNEKIFILSKSLNIFR
ncbi:MAG: GNAT family N-acetyltransferase [Candidatus Hodarchaeota archaeon]